MLVPTDEEEAGTGQLVGLVQTEPWLAAHSSVHLSFLIIPFCFHLPSPIHHAAAAGIGIGGVHLLV